MRSTYSRVKQPFVTPKVDCKQQRLIAIRSHRYVPKCRLTSPEHVHTHFEWPHQKNHTGISNEMIKLWGRWSAWIWIKNDIHTVLYVCVWLSNFNAIEPRSFGPSSPKHLAAKSAFSLSTFCTICVNSVEIKRWIGLFSQSSEKPRVS